MLKYKEVPQHLTHELKLKSKDYCVCIPVINEGDKIQKQLHRMKEANISNYADIIICDGGSSDDSLNHDFLVTHDVMTLLVKQDSGKLSAQLRMGYAYALNKGYLGIITIDGNNKDSVENIINIIDKLKDGYDFVQGSRFIPGGQAINTPLIRHIAVKSIHIPSISHMAGFKYTDTTNGFRGYSRKLLEDEQVEPFRNIFDSYELLAYLSVKAPRLGYKVVEIPVTRTYPKTGKVPTKISFVKGNSKLLTILKNLYLNKYDPV